MKWPVLKARKSIKNSYTHDIPHVSAKHVAIFRDGKAKYKCIKNQITEVSKPIHVY